MQEDVNHPPYYGGKIETIEIIRHYCCDMANVFKYLLRAGKKEISSERKDLRKALWYLKDYTFTYLDSLKDHEYISFEPTKEAIKNFKRFKDNQKYEVLMDKLKFQGLIITRGAGDKKICLEVIKELENILDNGCWVNGKLIEGIKTRQLRFNFKNK